MACGESLKRMVVRPVVVFFSGLCALCLTGCMGGGTTGSGDISPSIKVYGSVTNQQGKAVSSGTVTDLKGGNTAPVDLDGNFELAAVSDDGSVSLDVTAQGTSGTVQLKDLPASAQTVAIKVVVDSVAGIVTLASVEIDPVDSGAGEGEDPGGTEVSQQVHGLITGSTGKPARNVTVSIVGSRRSVKTGTAGMFTLTSTGKKPALTLRLTYKGLTGTAVIRGIPTNRSCTLRVRLSISIEAGQNPGSGEGGGAKLSVGVGRVRVS